MFNRRAGATIVEIVIAFGLAAILLPALFTGIYATQSGKAQQIQRLGALNLLKEEEEAVRSFREKNWENFAALDNGTPYHTQVSNPTWSLVSAVDNSTPGYHRWVTINKYSRGGNDDPSTKRVDLFVSWDKPISSQVTSTMYLTRYVSNNFFGDTTVTNFQKGIFTSTDVDTADTDGNGRVVLKRDAGGGDWCNPSLSVTNIDLSGQGVPNAVSAIPGEVFAATGQNASGVSFADVRLSDPPVPVSPYGTFDGYKTNGIFGNSSYAYIATDNNQREIVIIDLSQKDASGKFPQAGVFNAPGNGNGNSVYVTSSYGFMTSSAGNKLYNFNKIGSSLPTDNDGVALDGAGVKTVVIGNRAYVAINSVTRQLDIIDVSDPTNLRKIDYVQVPGQAGKDVFINPTGTRAYLVTGASGSQKEFFIINIDPGSPDYKRVYGTFDTNGMDPYGVTIVSGPKAIIVGHNGDEYQVVDISNEMVLPSIPCGVLNVDTGINGVASVVAASGRTYSYIITSVHAKELQIIQGGSGGSGGYLSPGTYESGTSWPTLTMPTTNRTAFNRFDVHYNKPVGTDIQFQVAVADPVPAGCTGAGCSCMGASFSYSTAFTTPATTGINLLANYQIPFGTVGNYQNPDKCFRYKTTLQGTSGSTPSLNDITINYSP